MFSEQRQIKLSRARGVLHKADPAEVILKAIARVNAGEPWLDRGSLGRLLGTLSRRAAETEEVRRIPRSPPQSAKS